MKLFLLFIFLFNFCLPSANFEKILIINNWKITSIKRSTGEITNSNSIKWITDSTSIQRGQIISFNKNHTCRVIKKNKGVELWDELDQFLWSIDSEGNLVIKNKKFINVFSFKPIHFSNQSIELSSTSKAIESKGSQTVIYKLEKQISN